MENNKTNNDKIMINTIKECSLLYKMAYRPCTETAMCWLWECNNGWFNVLHDASLILEGLNHICYHNHRVYVQSSQVKEKYGTLRWYYDVVCDPCPVICAYERFARWLMDKIGKVDFKQKRVVDREAYVSDEIKELNTAEEIADAERSAKLCSNIFVEDRNGKKVKITKLEHMAVSHLEATKHKLFWAIWKRRYLIINFLRNLVNWEPSVEQRAVMAYVELEASKIVKKAEDDCYCVCENCGRHIGDSWSPRCETRGWISYICDECAENCGREYYKDGALWKGKTCIKAKEEIDAGCKAIEDKMQEKF